jgi:hypothetical protein
MLKNMDAVETGVKTATEQSPDKVADLRRLLGEIEPTADTLGSDFVARTKTARLQLNRAYAEVLHKDAKDYAEANADKGKLALARYTKAEDEIIKLLDEAAKLKPKVKELTDFYEGHYKEIISESDELVTATYPDAAIEKLPWKDLLAGEQATFWNAAQVQGFSHAIQAGVLTLIGPDANAKNMGLISIGDREQWRDFVVNMDFTLESGDFKLFLRLGQRADSTVAQVNFKTGTEPGNIVAGKKYSVTIKMIGSLVTMTYYPEDQQYEPVKTSWTWSRRGALGFSLSPETRLTVSRLRVKELRASSK